MAKKKIKITTLQFMKTFSEMHVLEKAKILQKLQKLRVPKNEPEQEKTRLTFEALKSWCSVNMTVGADLCPPTMEHLSIFIIKK